MSFERRKARTGRVISDKMDKTVVVYIERRRSHRLYKKSIQVRKRYVAHDPENEARLGDLVRLVETRPISKTKRWRLVEVLERGDVAEVQPDDIKLAEDVQVAQRLSAEEQEAAVEAITAAAAAAAAAREAAEAEPEPEAEPEAAAKPEPEAEAKVEEEAEPEPEPEAAAEPEAAVEVEPEPEATAEKQEDKE
jgi:small subunit ribosomal protein S17